MQFDELVKKYNDPEKMASVYLEKYFGGRKIEFPINPFQMLKDEGILFVLMNFKNLEGVYIPSKGENDLPVVGININRPITRQRYSAAHELCHHLRDADKEVSCPIGRKNATERFAEDFAAALLMPIDDLYEQVSARIKDHTIITMDDVLEISDYFGVSFQACLFRIAYKVHAIDGNIDSRELRKLINKYRPDNVRKARNMSYVKLYEGLIDCYQEQLTLEQCNHARFVFQNNYIFNDSRMEGIEVSEEQASEIVTDLRMNTRNSKYCSEEKTNEVFMSIAGHYDMYQNIFTEKNNDSMGIYYLLKLNRLLFSYYPYPDYGGRIRKSNTLVLGVKFETVDYSDIFSELDRLNGMIIDFNNHRSDSTLSEYIEHVVYIHHQITVIHPFSDGNGRTSRAFMNWMFIRAGITPVYIKTEDKEEYVNALSRADQCGDYDGLYELIFRIILRSSVELK